MRIETRHDNPFVARPRTGIPAAVSRGRNRVLEDPDSLDLDFNAIAGLEVASPVASFQLAASRNRPAPPDFPRMDRLESGEELKHLRERPEGSLAFADPRIFMDERAIPIAEPFLVVHAHSDCLVPQLSELVPGHDAWPEGVRPILPRSRPHAGAARRRLEVSGREIVEDRDAEEMGIGLRGVDVPPALTEDEADLSPVIHLGGGDEPRGTSLECLEAHWRDGLLRPDDIQRIAVIIGRQRVPLRWDLGPRGRPRARDMGPKREEVSQQPRSDRRMDSHIARPKRPQRGVGLDLLGLGQHPERPVPYVALQPGTRIDELKRVRRDAGIHRGEVDDFFPVVPPAEDRAQAGRSSGRRESHEPHARLQAPRSPNRIQNAEEVTVSPWLSRRAIPSLRPKAGPVGRSRTSSARTPDRGTRTRAS